MSSQVQKGDLAPNTSIPSGILVWDGTSGNMAAAIKTTLNTTIDSNGFIKAASPIIKLFADTIETNAQAQEQQPQFTKNGVGDYTITGTSGLAKEGWWIETPKDANGNIKCFVEYADIEQPDGTFTLNIKTFAPDYSTGPATAGAPCDISSGRFISLRLNELPAPEIEELQPTDTE